MSAVLEKTITSESSASRASEIRRIDELNRSEAVAQYIATYPDDVANNYGFVYKFHKNNPNTAIQIDGQPIQAGFNSDVTGNPGGMLTFDGPESAREYLQYAYDTETNLAQEFINNIDGNRQAALDNLLRTSLGIAEGTETSQAISELQSRYSLTDDIGLGSVYGGQFNIVGESFDTLGKSNGPISKFVQYLVRAGLISYDESKQEITFTAKPGSRNTFEFHIADAPLNMFPPIEYWTTEMLDTLYILQTGSVDIVANATELSATEQDGIYTYIHGSLTPDREVEKARLELLSKTELFRGKPMVVHMNVAPNSSEVSGLIEIAKHAVLLNQPILIENNRYGTPPNAKYLNGAQFVEVFQEVIAELQKNFSDEQIQRNVRILLDTAHFHCANAAELNRQNVPFSDEEIPDYKAKIKAAQESTIASMQLVAENLGQYISHIHLAQTSGIADTHPGDLSREEELNTQTAVNGLQTTPIVECLQVLADTLDFEQYSKLRIVTEQSHLLTQSQIDQIVGKVKVLDQSGVN